MDTESGRIYLEEEVKRRLKPGYDEEFRRRFDEGKIVPVSDKVAIQQLAGQEALARKARRKAQKAARKRNRGNNE